VVESTLAIKKRLLKAGIKMLFLGVAVCGLTTVRCHAATSTYWNQLEGNVRIKFDIDNESTGHDRISVQNSSGGWKELKSGLTLTQLYYTARDEFTPAVTRKGVSADLSGSGNFALAKTQTDSGTRQLVVFPDGVIISPVLDWTASEFRSFKYKDESYAVLSFKADASGRTGTYLVRVRDGLTMRVSEGSFSKNELKIEINDGFASFNFARKVDLDAFDAEARHFAVRLETEKVIDKNGNVVDAITAVKSQYRDLVAEAKAHPELFPERADPETIQEIASALRSRRSAVLLGEPGTGKTSAIRAFAREVALGRVRGFPRNFEIRVVSPASLQTDSTEIGITERRVGALRSYGHRGNVAYFMDELHSLSGVGTHAHKFTDVAQDLKGDMENGDFLIVGSDNDYEFRNAFRKDPAFIDRFDLIHAKAPVGDELRAVISAGIKRDAPTDRVPPSLEAIDEAIRVSDDFDVITRQPRAAINLLKKAYDIKAAEGIYDKAPTIADIREAAIKKDRLDPGLFDPQVRRQKLANLQAGLSERIVGQENAKRELNAVWQRRISGVGDPEEVNSILFYGNPGVGKTRIAKLSAALMGYDNSTIEMNQYAHGGIDKFRSEVAGELAKNPFRAILFDEIEKAHPDVQNAALSMLQSGEFTVIDEAIGGGQVRNTIRARNAIFLMTTNAAGKSGGRLTGDELKAALHQGGITEAILSRIQRVVHMQNPTADEFREALRRYLHESLARESNTQHAHFDLQNENEFLNDMLQRFTPESDYRDVRKLVNREVIDIVAEAVNHDHFRQGARVNLSWHSDAKRLTFECLEGQLQHDL
jgi:ATP-dependent Clp protease ATP-binding subunit ClpA